MTDDYLPWLQTAVQDTRELLGLGGPQWHIFVSVEDNPHGCKDAAAATVIDGNLNADIRFRSGLPQDNNTRQQVFHELLHVALSAVDGTVHTFFNELPPDTGRLAWEIYQQVQERAMQRITRALMNQLHPIDP